MFSKKKKSAEKADEVKTESTVDLSSLSEEERAQAEADAVLKKFDRESTFRDMLSKPLTIAVGVVLFLFAIFQIYTTIFTIPSGLLRVFHMTFVLVLVFLLFPVKRGIHRDKIPWYDWVLVGVTLVVMLYIPFRYDYIISNMGNYGPLETIVGCLGILLVFEACRRCVGVPIMIIVGAFVLYTLFGNYLPGMFSHRGYSLARVASHMFFTQEGIFGTPVGVSSTFIFLFIMFGAFLEKTGVGKLFIDISNAIAGKYSGGPAKVAVIASALEGTVSGSSVSNTVGSGSFTIPAMCKLGYGREFAAAVEAAASTGGQIMPPIMGAAAFLMAEITGYQYKDIVLAAIIPAILYFTGVLISVHHEAKKLGLVGMKAEDLPKLGILLKTKGHLLLPLIFIVFILGEGLTPSYAALGAILAALMAFSLGYLSLVPIGVIGAGLVMGFNIQITAVVAIAVWFAICIVRMVIRFNKKKKNPELNIIPEDANPKSKAAEVASIALNFHPFEIVNAMTTGARGVLAVAVACAMAGMIVGSVTLTGLGMKFATGLATLSGGNLYLMLFFTMLASIILGMGVPTTANYLITSTICAPAIISMLVSMQGLAEPTKAIIISAHLFVFYFGIIADITPPVALAAMAGAAISKGDPFKTGVTATRIAIAAFIVPYIFVLSPEMLMIDTTILEVIQVTLTAIVGMYAVSGALTGYILDTCYWFEVILLLGGGLCLIIPGTLTDLIGIVVVAAVMAFQYFRKKRGKSLKKA